MIEDYCVDMEYSPNDRVFNPQQDTLENLSPGSSNNFKRFSMEEMRIIDEDISNPEQIVLQTSEADMSHCQFISGSNYMSSSYADPIDHARFASRKSFQNTNYNTGYYNSKSSKWSHSGYFQNSKDAEHFRKFGISKDFFKEKYSSNSQQDEEFMKDLRVLDDSVYKNYIDQTSRGSSKENSPIGGNLFAGSSHYGDARAKLPKAERARQLKDFSIVQEEEEFDERNASHTYKSNGKKSRAGSRNSRTESVNSS